VKNEYFFGYFFVRAAKGIALAVVIVGIGFCMLQYSRAKIAASSAAYQPSPFLQRALGKLKDAFSSTNQIVASFNTANRSATPKVQLARFPRVINFNADFSQVADELSRVDQERQQLKQSIVNRFETSVRSIEEKLRAYAAGLQSSSLPTPTASSSPIARATPSPPPTSPPESLFSSKVGGSEVNQRSANLTQRKEFLKVLGTRAENPDNRARLNEAADQLELLTKLLPEKFEALATTQVELAPTSSSESPTEQGRKVLLSERVAGQLEQLRREVRQMLLTSWTLDEAFEQAADLTSVERDKCRVATLAQKEIWLSAVSRIVIAWLAAVLASFLILVCADLVQTRLDTASNTGVMADAIKAIRGWARPAPQSEWHDQS
jgi:hypothetical protein